jgi:transcriptional regulator with XRE-family HTH domain
MSEITSITAFTQPTTSSVSARIRKQRKARSLTLQDIERLSSRRIKAVVMGSYERGTRAISVARAIEIANLFAIPLSELLEEPRPKEGGNDDLIIFDLRRLHKTENLISTPDISKLKIFVSAICAKRRDWNGEVLTIRSGDLDTLTLILERDISEVRNFLDRSQLLLQTPGY